MKFALLVMVLALAGCATTPKVPIPVTAMSTELIFQEIAKYHYWLEANGRLLHKMYGPEKKEEFKGTPPTTAEIKEHLNKLLESGKKIQKMPAGSPSPTSHSGQGVRAVGVRTELCRES